MKSTICLLKMVSFQLLVLLFAHNNAFAQQVALVGEPDTLFPVTNRFIPAGDGPSSTHSLQNIASVYNITSNDSKYYFFGNFTNVAKKTGSSVIIDSATGNIINRLKWQINGAVYTSIPDGMGGFYIGGEFTKIGDSTRNYIAQVDQSGKPTSWNPGSDSVVQQITKRNDTLFLAGLFSKINDQPRPKFAMWSINSNSLLLTATTGRFTLLRAINSFLLDHDTIIYAASRSSGSIPMVGKYNIRNNTYNTSWQFVLPVGVELTRPEVLHFNADSSVIICQFYDNSTGIYSVRGFNKITGAHIYKLYPSKDGAGDVIPGAVKIKVMNNKAYMVGPFERVWPNTGNYVERKGFAVFDASTGALLNDILSIHGYTYFIDGRDGKLFLSGAFDSVNAQPRLNFAVMDTGTYNLDAWQLSPTDPLMTLSFSQGSIFSSGFFHGIYAVPRKGMAAIDSASGEILPWTPTGFECDGIKKMQVRGDTLFVVGDVPINCSVGLNAINGFHMYRISTGEEITSYGNMHGNINTFLINDNYIYVAHDQQMTRYILPNLSNSSWTVNLEVQPGSYHFCVTGMVLKNDTLYCAGDERFKACGVSINNKTWVAKIPISTGTPFVAFHYDPSLPDIDQSRFEYAALSGNNRLFIQGDFSDFNGLDRNHLMSVNTDDGSITNLQSPFSYNNDLWGMAPITCFNGKVWTGGYTTMTLSDGSFFPGFGAVDTATGSLDNPPLISLPSYHRFLKIYPDLLTEVFDPNVKHYILNNNELVIVGLFDSLNQVTAGNLARYKINVTGKTYTFTGNGNWNISSNWMNNEMPPAILPGTEAILISPVPGGNCILNIIQTVTAGSTFTVTAGSNFIIQGNLNVVE